MADYTPKSYFEEKIAQKLVAKPETSKAVNSIYEFNITGENGGVSHMSSGPAGTTSQWPCRISDRPADVAGR